MSNTFSDGQYSPELREKDRVPAGIFSALGAGSSNPLCSTIQSPVFGYLRESLEIRACARDLRSCMDPENALGSPNP